MNDLKFALRQLFHAPAFSALAIVTLALAIGMNTAIFSVVDALLINPFAYPEHARIVALTQQKPKTSAAMEALHTGKEFGAYQEQARSFSSLSAIETVSRNLTVGNENPERVAGGKTNAEFFTVLGVSPQMGRVLQSSDQGEGKPRVVVLGHELWKTRFNSDPQIIGKTLELDTEPFTIVGVMPPRFQFAGTTFWFPYPFEIRHAAPRYNRVLGRLAPGVSLAAANAELTTIAARIAQDNRSVSDYGNWSLAALSLRDALLGQVRPAVLILSGAVGVVLLIACANVAGLLLVRANKREREIAIRAAIGASRRQLLKQFLVESIVLATMGGGLGLLLAAWGVEGLGKLLPEAGLLDGGIPSEAMIHLSRPVLLFALGVTFATTLLCGLWPAWQAARTDASLALRHGDRAGQARHPLRSALITGEIALAVVLLAGAGLLLRSFAHLIQIEPGFRTKRLLTLRLNLPPARYDGMAKTAAVIDRITNQVRALPGVRSVAAVSHPPFSYTDPYAFALEGRTAPEQRMSAGNRLVSPNYYEAMGIPLLRGRPFTDQDRAGQPGVLIVNETMARRVWPNADPIGQRLTIYVGGRELPVTVVGVVADSRQVNLEQPTEAELNLPLAQGAAFLRRFNLLVRADLDPASLVPAIRREIWKVDPQLPLYNILTMERAVAETLSVRRFALYLLAGFAGLALLLAISGIYGVIAYSVAQRTREIGVRMALGAAPGKILGMIIRQGAVLAVAGVGIGVMVACGLTQFLRALLFAVTPTDPLTFCAVALVLLAASLCACWLPARRAARTDPMVALRSE